MTEWIVAFCKCSINEEKLSEMDQFSQLFTLHIILIKKMQEVDEVLRLIYNIK